MIESTVIDKLKQENKKLKTQLDNWIKDYGALAEALGKEVIKYRDANLALQSKLDEIDTAPIYQYSNTHNVNLWTDCNADVFSIMKETHRRVVFRMKGT